MNARKTTRGVPVEDPPPGGAIRVVSTIFTSTNTTYMVLTQLFRAATTHPCSCFLRLLMCIGDGSVLEFIFCADGAS